MKLKKFESKELELMLIVSKEESVLSYIEKYNLYDIDGYIDIRAILIETGFARLNYSGRVKHHIKKLGLQDRFKIIERGSFKDYIFNQDDSIKLLESMIRTKLSYDHGINDLDEQVVFSHKGKGIDPAYRKWCGMLERCYSAKWHEKKPTYKDCSVSDEWLFFSNFKKWFDENNIKGYVLDKDILQKNNKVYSKETCVFVPEYINSLFIKKDAVRGKYPIGVTKSYKRFSACFSIKNKRKELGTFPTPEVAFSAYKKGKEGYIKDVAKEYYGRNEICKKTYQALCSYVVEITD